MSARLTGRAGCQRECAYDDLRAAVARRDGEVVASNPRFVRLRGHYAFHATACAPLGQLAGDDVAAAGPAVADRDLPTVLRIVSRWAPVRQWISRCERGSTCFIRLISAHCSTPSNAFPPVSIVRSSQIKGPVGRLRPRAAVDHF
jgi:hypothetical protein